MNWLLNNGLHPNPSKSEAIAFSNPRSKPLVALAESVPFIIVAGSPIQLQPYVFDKLVSEIFKASYFHIWALCHIRSSLTTEAAKYNSRGNSRLDMFWFCITAVIIHYSIFNQLCINYLQSNLLMCEFGSKL